MIASLIATCLLICILTWICIQDFRERQVYVYCYPLLAISALGVQYTHCGFGDLFIENVIVNSSILLVQFGIIAVYFKYVRGTALKAAIGLGDLLFYFCLTLFMSVPVFIVFNILSLLTVIVLYLLVRKQLAIHRNSIPLAGIQAACLIIVQTYDYCYMNILGTCYIPQWIIR